MAIGVCLLKLTCCDSELGISTHDGSNYVYAMLKHLYSFQLHSTLSDKTAFGIYTNTCALEERNSARSHHWSTVYGLMLHQCSAWNIFSTHSLFNGLQNHERAWFTLIYMMGPFTAYMIFYVWKICHDSILKNQQLCSFTFWVPYPSNDC